jgi:carbon-monoxide dehydrogenase large subunit
MPRADDLPMFHVIDLRDTPCPGNPLGMKGCGEAGCDRLDAGGDQRHHRCASACNELPMPATPQVVWKAAQAARRPMAAE